MSFNLVDILLLLASAQGLFLSILILHKHRHLYANRFLGLLIFGYSTILLYLFLDEIGFNVQRPIIPIIALGFIFVAGPLHYLYAKYLTGQIQKFRKKEWSHFIPLAVYHLVFLPSASPAQPVFLNALHGSAGDRISPFFLSLNWFILVYSACYIIPILGLIKRYRHDIKGLFSSLEQIRMDWLRNITWMAIGTLSIFALENAFYLFGIDVSNQFSLTSGLVAVYIYALGYMGLIRSEVFSHADLSESIRHLPESKYQKSGLKPEQAQKYVQDLKRLMEEEQPYVDPELTLNSLAGKLSISPHNLSEVINTQLDQNLFDFVNGYRVEKVKQDLIDPAKKYLKVLAIGLDAGFNSKTSFNTTFKKHTAMTPSQYRQQYG